MLFPFCWFDHWRLCAFDWVVARCYETITRWQDLEYEMVFSLSILSINTGNYGNILFGYHVTECYWNHFKLYCRQFYFWYGWISIPKRQIWKVRTILWKESETYSTTSTTSMPTIYQTSFYLSLAIHYIYICLFVFILWIHCPPSRKPEPLGHETVCNFSQWE